MRASGNAKGPTGNGCRPFAGKHLPAPFRGGYAGKVYTSRPEVLFNRKEATG
jgi:hypothetical protein